MRELLFVSWIALIGATRIDLAGGAADFLVPPFLLLSPILITVEIGVAAGRGGAFRLPANTAAYFLTVSALLGVVLLSTFLSAEPTSSARRFALLALQVYSVLVVALALANRSDAGKLLVHGAYAGLLIYLLFNLAQIILWFSGMAIGGFDPMWVDLDVRTYAGLIPRLSGSAHDPSIGGLLLLVYLFVILQWGRPSRLTVILVGAGVISLLLTLSRSVILAGLAMIVAEVILRGRLRITPRAIALTAAGAAVGAFLLFVSPGALERVTGIADLLGHRLTFAEGSSSDHAAVMSRAWEVGTANMKHLLIGIGYGNAYLVLQDIFPGSRYGNFHSLYMTLFAESGIFALLLMLLLLFVGLFRYNPWRPAIAALIVYNIFQQTQSDPVLWLVLSLAWLSVSVQAASDRPGPTGGEWKVVSDAEAARTLAAPGPVRGYDSMSSG